MNAPALITARPIQSPRYTNATVTLETFERWFIVNSAALRGYWAELQQHDDELTQSDFLLFCQCQYDSARMQANVSHRPVSGECLRSSVAVLEADTSGESCRESSPTMEESAAGRADDHSVCSRLAHVTGSESPTSAATACKSSSQGQKDVSTDPRTAGVGALYPVTCRERYYEAASRILEEEGQIWTHDNADELGHVIQKWIEETRNNWEPR